MDSYCSFRFCGARNFNIDRTRYGAPMLIALALFRSVLDELLASAPADRPDPAEFDRECVGERR